MSALWTRCENTIWHPREVRSQGTLASNLRVLRVIDIETNEGRRTFGDIPVSEVRYSTLDALKDALFSRGYAAGTVARKLAMVGASLTQATRWEIITGKPAMPRVKVDNARKRIISEAEEVAIHEAIAARLDAEPHRDWRRYDLLLRFLMETACRLGEALACKRSWFEETPTGWNLTIPSEASKSGKDGTIPASDVVVAMLPWLEANAHRDGRLFPMSASTAQYYWRENVVPDVLARDGFDLSDAVLHTFRHTKLTRLFRLPDYGIVRVSRFARHSDVSITASVYVKTDADDLRVPAC